MAFGLEFINDAGSLCISESYKNPVLVASGTATTVVQSLWEPPSQFTITYVRSSLTEIPILAIRPTDMTMLVGIGDTASLTWTWTFYSNQAVGTSVPYWIFSNQATITADPWGLEVFNSSGARVFSSAMKPLRIKTRVAFTVTTFSSTDYTYDTGRTYAAVLTQWADDAGRYFAMGDYTDFHAGGVMGISNGIRAGGVYYAQSSGDQRGGTWTSMPFLVADVTNY